MLIFPGYEVIVSDEFQRLEGPTKETINYLHLVNYNNIRQICKMRYFFRKNVL